MPDSVINKDMEEQDIYDVIIIGGSYAGLAAAMALGRALKKVLVIDNGLPCNRQTPHSHNFLTNDGRTPAEIAALARFQVGLYPTIDFLNETVLTGNKLKEIFEIRLASEKVYHASKLIFATGIKDLLPNIQGLKECWGISVIHCPYCHGYEVRGESTGILGVNENTFDFARLISNWTNDLTIFTNGAKGLNPDQQEQLTRHGIKLIDKVIYAIEHERGQLSYILFEDGTRHLLKVLYAPSPFEQHCKIPQQMGCELNEEGYLKIDGTNETSIKGIYAVGDNASKMRTVANAVAMGTTTGMIISKQMILETFQ